MLLKLQSPDFFMFCFTKYLTKYLDLDQNLGRKSIKHSFGLTFLYCIPQGSAMLKLVLKIKWISEMLMWLVRQFFLCIV